MRGKRSLYPLVRNGLRLSLAAASLACSSEPPGYPSYAATTTSGTGSGSTTGGAAVAFANFTEASQWIGSTCGVTGCHNNRYPPSLSNADLGILQYSLTSYPVPDCGGVPLVIPGNPEGSGITMAVTGLCGDLLMPFGCITPPEAPCVSTDDLAKLKGWIANGASFQ